MQIVRALRPRAWLLVLLCGVAIGCGGDPENQVVTGRVASAEDALAIRAVSGTAVVTAAQVRTDGSFTLVLPSGVSYRLEILTRTGAVKHLVAAGDGGALRDVTFRVCTPVDPYSIGSIDKCSPPSPAPCNDPADPNCKCDPNGNCYPVPCDPTTDPNCKCDPGTGQNCCTDPNDPACNPPPPPSCDPTTDPNCKCDPDGNCYPVPCGPNDPGCDCDATGNCPPPPPPCDPTTDPNCKCDPATGQNCDPGCTDPSDPNCNPPPPPPCDPNTDPNCKCDPSTGQNCDPGCDPTTGQVCPPSPCDDPNTPGCLPPCNDPTDPNTCKDPCVDDPAACGCTSTDPNCWPQPSPCDPNGTCKAGDGVTAEHPPGDFGCTEDATR